MATTSKAAATITSLYKSISCVAKRLKCPHRYPQINSGTSIAGFRPIPSLVLATTMRRIVPVRRFSRQELAPDATFVFCTLVARPVNPAFGFASCFAAAQVSTILRQLLVAVLQRLCGGTALLRLPALMFQL